MELKSKIYVAGHRGMAGSSIVRKLESLGYTNIIKKTSTELDLRNQQAVEDFFKLEQPEYVFNAAAKVGGIVANYEYRAEFIYDNLMMECNIIHQSYLNGVKKLLFLGSSCIYPKLAPQPLKEEYLLSGYLEETNQAYAIAKIAGLKMCEMYRGQYGCNFISVMPTNLYGPNDNYDLEKGHVLAALLRKFVTAKSEGLDRVEIWGSGKPKREFMFVDDLAEACIFLMKNYNETELVNVGTGVDLTIAELAGLIKDITGFDGSIVWNSERPDGTPRKLMDVSKINALGWKAKVNLEEGLRMVYNEIKDRKF
jgi:GDP-L-fucose synthase